MRKVKTIPKKSVGEKRLKRTFLLLGSGKVVQGRYDKAHELQETSVKQKVQTQISTLTRKGSVGNKEQN